MMVPVTLNDDVMLCILGHCDIDTFLTARLLSRSIYGLILQYSSHLCTAIAQRTFPDRKVLLQSTDLRDSRDATWLKDLRIQHLASVVVECSCRERCPDELLGAESTSKEVIKYRSAVAKGWRIFARLHNTIHRVMGMAPNDLNEDSKFRLEPQIERAFCMSIGIRQHLCLCDDGANRSLGSRNESATFGGQDIAPFDLDERTTEVWRREWSYLPKMIQVLQESSTEARWGFRKLLQALAFESLGRQPLNSGDRWHTDWDFRWDQTRTMADNLLANPFYWLLLTSMEIGPQMYWKQWSAAVYDPTEFSQELETAWKKACLEQRVIRSLVGKAVLFCLNALTERESNKSISPVSYPIWSVFPIRRRSLQEPSKSNIFPDLMLGLATKLEVDRDELETRILHTHESWYTCVRKPKGEEL